MLRSLDNEMYDSFVVNDIIFPTYPKPILPKSKSQQTIQKN